MQESITTLWRLHPWEQKSILLQEGDLIVSRFMDNCITIQPLLNISTKNDLISLIQNTPNFTFWTLPKQMNLG
jgi:hypothetical protein